MSLISHWLILLSTVFLGVTLVWQVRETVRAWKAPRWFEWGVATGIFLAGFVLRWWVAPHCVIHTNFHGMQFLEMSLSPRTPAEIVPVLPYGVGTYSFYRAFWWVLPRNPETLFGINALLSAATPVMLYGFLRSTGATWRWATLSAAVLCVLPPHVRLAPTESLYVPVSFAFLASMTLFASWLKTERIVALMAAVLWMFVTVHLRILTVTVPLFFLLVATLLHGRKPRLGWQVWAAGVLLLLGLLPHVWHVLTVVSGELHPERETLSAFLNAPNKWLVGENVLVFHPATSGLIPLFWLVGLWVLWRTRRSWFWFSLVTMALWGSLLLAFQTHPMDAIRYQYFVWPLWVIPVGALVEYPRQWLRWLSTNPAWLGTATTLLVVIVALPNATWTQRQTSLNTEYRWLMTQVKSIPDDAIWLLAPGIRSVRPIPKLQPPSFWLEQHGVEILDMKYVGCTTLRERCATDRCLYYAGLTEQTLCVEESTEVLGDDGLRMPLLDQCGLVLGDALSTRQLEATPPVPGPDLVFAGDSLQIGVWRVLPNPDSSSMTHQQEEICVDRGGGSEQNRSQ